LPYVDPTLTKTKLFSALIEVAYELDGNQGINSVFASYPVLVFADVPSTDNAYFATEEQLSIMTMVSIDDALWYLHKNMIKNGNGTANISGYLSSSSTISTTALFALAMQANNRIGAYPLGTYNNYGKTTPPDFLERNNTRYNNDPYSEDVIRALNYLLNNSHNISVPADDEDDDGLTSITGTNDGNGIYVYSTQNNEYNSGSLPLAALAFSGLAGTVAQVSNSVVQGKFLEFIVQQYVDFAIMSQIDENSLQNSLGSWQVYPCQNQITSPDKACSYITAGWVYALLSAEEKMSNYNVIVNNRMKNRLANAIYFGQHLDGGVKYVNSGIIYSESLAEPLGNYLLACRWLGWDLFSISDISSAGYPYLAVTKGALRETYNRYLNYLSMRWQDSYSLGSLINHNIVLWSDGNYSGITPGSNQSNLWTHSLFNVSTALNFLPEIFSIGIHQWKQEFNVSFVKGQFDDGNFSDAGNSLVSSFFGLLGATEYALLAMQQNVTTPLPVELTSFFANIKNNNVILKWSTATELNNYGFEVQREVRGQKSEGSNWEKIGFVEGNGNSNSPKNYQFVDKKLYGGSRFIYRLKQIDNDGKFSYSDEIEIEVIPNEYKLAQNYPNPFNPVTNFEFQIPAGGLVTLKICDILGNEVAAILNEELEAGFYRYQWDASGLASGIYFYQLKAGNFTETKKMILLR
jgi:hypothetical protein